MPTYEYGCITCRHEFDIIKTVSMIDNQEFCPKCNSVETERYISRTSFYGASDWDNVEYNPGLGIVTKNAKHRAREAKARGLIEVGNESFETVSKELEAKSTAISDARWEKTMEGVRYGLKKEMEKAS